MRKRIGIILSEEEIWDMGKSLLDMPFQKMYNFNMKEVNLYGAYRDYGWFGWRLFLTHPEFEKVPEGCECKVFRISDAKKRYPFLFSDTNPILYRKYGKETS